jgi:hypothetical protein
MPSDTVTPAQFAAGLVVYDGVTGQFAKQLTITNNSTTDTIYPFLRDANSRTALPGDPAPSPNYTGTGMFDPYDPLNHEYRGYIGYTQQMNGKTVAYMGLLPGHSITVNVPLAFWDGGRIFITTDGADLQGTGQNGNPFLYRDQSSQVTYYGSVSGNTLTFTPVYNSFAHNSTNNDWEPSAANWTPPANLATGMLVNGPGIPANTTVTVGSDTQSVTLVPPPGSSITTPAGVYNFTFTNNKAPISPSLRYTQSGFTLTDGPSSTTDGAVMWYQSLTAEGPNNDAPFGFVEPTFRGTFYNPKINMGTGFNYLIGFDTPTKPIISANDFDLVNYDISFVDGINLPLAAEAEAVPVLNTQPVVAPSFGWVGSSQTISGLQSALQSFTGANSSLGTYFGSQGYPTYYAPPGINSTKLPSGQNLFFSSPFTGSTSSFVLSKTFDTPPPNGSTATFNLYALTDGGPGPFSFLSGGDTDPNIPKPKPTQLVLHHTNGADIYTLQLLQQALKAQQQVQLTDIDGIAVPAGNFIGSMLYDPVTKQLVGVNLTQSLNLANPVSHTYTFTRPVMDPIATTIAGLWYSWASYYATAVKGPLPPPAAGTINSNILVLNNATTNLVPGMAVKDAQGNSHGVITAIASDNQTITLSQSSSGALADTFSFFAPDVKSINGYDPGTNNNGLTPITKFTFDAAHHDYALAFAQTVYLVMSTMSPSVSPTTPNAAIALLGNIIGGNVGSNYLPNENDAIQATITNEIKSALRGVPDFTSPLYSNPSQWYPDPALKAGGQTFNVYNLDPYIWFIHQKLGLSAYAFALDDDVGDVGAGGSTKLDVSVGGLGGLPVQYPFSNTANWGPVHGTTTTPPAVGSSVITGLPRQTVNQITGANFTNNVPGTLVTGPGVPIGTTVLVYDPLQNTVTLSAPVTSLAPSPATYYFYGPIVGTGTVLAPGQDTKTIRGLDTATYDALLQIVPLTSIQVTGPGLDPKSTVTVKSLTLDKGVRVVTLTQALDGSKIFEHGGSYAYTFGYAALSPISDAGFEQPTVTQLTNIYYENGAQIGKPIGDQPWTFTDGSDANKIYAGISAQGSIYSAGGPILQGLQVGFIQGNSSISQQVTFAAGSYQLKFLAAQAVGNTAANQSLEVMIDGNPVTTPPITGTSYVQYTTAVFKVTAGQHTITFLGKDGGSNTALIDAVMLST